MEMKIHVSRDFLLFISVSLAPWTYLAIAGTQIFVVRMVKWFVIRENMGYGKIIANNTVILNPFCNLYSDFVASSIKRWR